MSTPETSTLTAPSNGAAHQSTAESILATAVSMNAEDTTGSAAEVEDAADVVEAPEPTKRSLSWNDAIKQVPPDIAKLMKNMQGDYTRKTQELAEQRRDFMRERSALAAGTKSLEAPEVPEYDPFNEDTVKARIEAEVKARLREALEPMQQEYEVMQAEDSYKAFLSEHPDFSGDTALRSEVQSILETSPSVDLETAYWAAKGKQATVQAEVARSQKAAQRAAKREAAMRGTAPTRKAQAGGAPSKDTVRKMSNSDILALAQSLHRNG